MTSRVEPLAISWQTLHLPQGVGVGTPVEIQLRDLAKILALEVLPVPLGPVNRYAGAMRCCRMALVRVWAIASWPTNSANV